MKPVSRQSGFTLTEIAIAMLIIGLVLVASLGPVARQIEQSQRSDNQARLEAVRDALLTYASVNGRLPCPDRDGDGQENPRQSANPPAWGCENNIYEGFVPWATLGVQQGDHWGTRLRYRVSAEFTRRGNDPTWICGSTAGLSLNGQALAGCTPGGMPTGCTTSTSNPSSCTFEIGDGGDIPVRDGQVGRPGSIALMQPPTGAVVVILSHGSNRNGGTGQDGTVFPTPAGGTDESLNGPAIGAIAAGPRLAASPFISRPPLQVAATGCNDNGGTTLCEFDDQLIFVSAGTLISRMTQAGYRLQ